jgi:hypothetical protein
MIVSPVNSVPLSMTIVFGMPRSSAIRSRTRVTREPLIDVCTSIARASRVKSSTTFRVRIRRVPWTKSRDHRSFGIETAGGTSPRLKATRRFTRYELEDSPPRRRDRSACGWPQSHHAAEISRVADNQSVGAPRRALFVFQAMRYRRCAEVPDETSCGCKLRRTGLALAKPDLIHHRPSSSSPLRGVRSFPMQSLSERRSREQNRQAISLTDDSRLRASASSDVANIHAAKSRFSFVQRSRTNAVLAAEVRRFGAGLRLFEDADDLFSVNRDSLTRESPIGLLPAILYL